MERKTRASKGREPAIRPVQKVEVSQEHVKLRIAAVVVFLVIGLGALVYAVRELTSVPGGWQTVSATSTANSVADDLELLYNLGASGRSVRSESKELTSVYTGACQRAYRIFSAGEEFPGVGNLASLNLHPNEPVELDPALYAALELLDGFGERRIYLGPAYEIYDGVFSCTEEWQLEAFDPTKDPELRELFQKIAGFASDPGSVDIRLLDQGRAELFVSEEYLAFAAEQELGSFVDFYYLKNAFVTDYVADALAEAGFTYGVLSSYDGYGRNLDGGSGSMYSLDLPATADGRTFAAATMDYTGPMALVTLRGFPAGEMDGWYYRVLSDGTVRSRFLELESGLPAESTGLVVGYSRTLGCAGTALRALGVFLDSEDAAGEEDIQFVVVDGLELRYTDPELSLRGVYEGVDVKAVG